MVMQAEKVNSQKVVTQKGIFTSDNIPPVSSVTKNKAWAFIYAKRKAGHNYYYIRWTDKNGQQHTEYLGTAQEILRWKNIIKGDNKK